ncbi:MAG: hypothetical protein WCI03_01340 [bacterium]
MKEWVKIGAGVMLMAWVVSGAEPLKERHRLYTPPDPTASGGIIGVITTPAKPILQVLAMPPDEPQLVYEGQITGSNQQGFLFENLPMAKYDLFVIYEDEFYEGLELTYEPDTLTEKDRQSISYIVNASDPFFNKKVIHRVAGTTGRGNFARCVVTQYRDGPGTVSADYEVLKGISRRTFKLIWLKDVGVGWQVVQKRDLYPVTVAMKLLTPAHHYSKVLSRVRVTDQVKNLGDIKLVDEKKTAR